MLWADGLLASPAARLALCSAASLRPWTLAHLAANSREVRRGLFTRGVCWKALAGRRPTARTGCTPISSAATHMLLLASSVCDCRRGGYKTKNGGQKGWRRHADIWPAQAPSSAGGKTRESCCTKESV